MSQSLKQFLADGDLQVFRVVGHGQILDYLLSAGMLSVTGGRLCE
jgi:hypothetical protein